MKLKPQLLFDLAVLFFFAIFVYEAKDWRLQARLYPWVIGISMLALSVVHIVLELRSGSDKPSAQPTAVPVDIQFTQGVDPDVARRRAINVFCWIFGFFAGIWLLGFPLAVPAFIFLYLKVQSGERWGLSLALTGAAGLIFWGLFVRLLHIPFPEGAIFSLLGAP
jgi:tripartite tricarboxylate transporter TctB family protein